jgi:hypothetical protein
VEQEDKTKRYKVDNNVKPEPGQFTVCIRCGHLMVFAEDLSLRDPTDKEAYEIAGHPLMLATQRALALMRKEDIAVAEKLRFRDLLAAAKSQDPKIKQEGFAMFKAWVRASPNLKENQRLTHMERDVLTKLFGQKPE